MSEAFLQHIREELPKLKGITNELFQAEESIRYINDMNHEDADLARKRLDDARWELSHLLLNLPLKLSVFVLKDIAVREALPQIITICRFPCLSSANSIVGMFEELVCPELSSTSTPTDSKNGTAESLAVDLREAMRVKGHDKSAAAAAIGITTKTLTRLLGGMKTKASKQADAQQYINEAKRKSQK